MNLEKTSQKAIIYSFYLLFFLTPLILTPWTFELFEYNKMTFVYGMTIIISTAWIIKMTARRKIEIRRTPLDPFLLLFFLSCLLSTIFSLHPYTSFWGYYSRSHGGLLSISSYLILYYAFTTIAPRRCYSLKNINKNNSSEVKQPDQRFPVSCLYFLLASAFLVSLYGILEHSGIDENWWVQDVRNRVFSTLGQPNWLGAFIDALIFIPLGLIIKEHQLKKKNFLILSALYSLFFTLFLCLIFTNSKSAILAFFLCLPVFILLTAQRQNKSLKISLPLVCLILLIYLLIGQRSYQNLRSLPSWIKSFSTKTEKVVPPSQPDLKYAPRISASSEIRRIVWQGALEIWKNYPLLGSGLETFAYSYYRFRPQEHNLLSEWDFLYNRAHNEFLNILACQGIVGLISYLGLIAGFLVWFFKLMKKTLPLSHSPTFLFSFLCGYLSLLITNFFGFSVVITGLLFFFLPAFCFNLYSSQTPKRKSSPSFCLNLPVISAKDEAGASKLIHFFTFLFLFLAVYLLLFLSRRWRGDYFFNRGKKLYEADYLLPALTDLEKAISFSPQESLYHAQLAKTAAKMALVYDQLEATISAEISPQLASLAENEAALALQLNPQHLNFYKAQAEVFLALAYFDPEYQQKALATLREATKLAPTDAKLLYNLGLLLLEAGQTDLAIKEFKQAIKLKPNYRQAYFQLGQAYLQAEQPEEAKQSLKFILQHIDPQDEKAQKLLGSF